MHSTLPKIWLFYTANSHLPIFSGNYFWNDNNIGGCGVNTGRSQLEQNCIEQGIGPNGDKEYKTKYDNNISALFEELSNGQYVARNIFTDLNPYSIENIKKRYKYRNILQEDYLINGFEDGALNFAKYFLKSLAYHKLNWIIIEYTNLYIGEKAVTI